MGLGIISPVPKVSSYCLSVKMSLAVIMALADPCFPGLAVEKAVTLQGHCSFMMMREPGFMRPASASSVLRAPESPVSNSFSSDIIAVLVNFN